MSQPAAPTPNDVAAQQADPQQADPQQADPQQADPQPAQQPAEDKGFPADTPLAEMSVEQREAYWKDKSRKHENRAKERIDPAEYQRVLEQLQQQQRADETEHEAALREAREAAAAEAVQGFHTQTAASMARMALRAKGVQDDDEVKAFIEETNFATFIGEGGTVDEERLWARVERYTGTGSAQQWPGTGQDRHSTRIKESGSELYDRMHGTTSK